MLCKKLHQGSRPKPKDDVSLKKKKLTCQALPRFSTKKCGRGNKPFARCHSTNYMCVLVNRRLRGYRRVLPFLLIAAARYRYPGARAAERRRGHPSDGRIRRCVR